jgi:type II secretory pathway pseudopilin PulG
MLVVIGIIGLIAGMTVVAVSSARAKARDAQRMSNFEEIQKALEFYFTENEKYPAGEEGGICMKDLEGLQTALAPWLTPLPDDPLLTQGHQCYAYFSDAEGTGYKIMADLEKHPEMEENDCGVYSDRYELCDVDGTFAAATFGGEFWFGGGGGEVGGEWALDFEGETEVPGASGPIGDYLEAPKGTGDDVIEENEYTLEAWIKLSQAQEDLEDINSVCIDTGFCEAKGAALAIAQREPVLYHAAYTELEPGKPVAYWHLLESNTDISLSQWHFLAATYNGSDIKIYVDGDFKNSKTVPGFVNDDNANLFIGAIASWSDLDYTQGHFQGIIDEVRVYDYAIASDIIENHFKGEYNEWGLIPFPGKEKPPVAHWKFEEGAGSTTIDERSDEPAELKPAGGGPEWVPNN